MVDKVRAGGGGGGEIVIVNQHKTWQVSTHSVIIVPMNKRVGLPI
jgi:hypothetical protein